MLEMDQVDVSRGGVQVLRKISLELKSGQTTVLVGRNGAGKTTTLRSIMGLLPMDGGKVVLDGQNISELPAYRRAGLGIGYSPEDRGMIATFSVEENISLPAYALKLSARERRSRLQSVYKLLPEVEEFRERSGGALSGGQGKMVALARALMVATQAVLLDEPFQGLAPALALNYARILSRVREQRKELALFVTESSPDLLNEIVDETFIIERGAVMPVAS